MSGITVLKFGSSVLRGRRDLGHAVHEIYRELREGRRVVAVVSAIGNATDRLLGEARRSGNDVEPGPLALLLSTGETRSVALVALALERAGIACSALDATRAGLRTQGPLLDADPCGLDAGAIRRALEEHPVVVLPGFVGCDASGRTSLLGRGGSDLSALFIAERLGRAACRLLKDVDGIYERDPAADGPHPAARARRYATLHWDDALGIGGAVVQTKALRFAREHGLTFEVARVGASTCTRVGPEASRFDSSQPSPRRLSVALLGAGTVGFGVYRELLRFPHLFDVRSILVRDRFKRRTSSLPLDLSTADPREALAADCDVYVELLGGTQTAAALVETVLTRGRDVVTANKALVVERGKELRAIARTTGARFSCSATVGGALPVLETVRSVARDRQIVGFEGILNSTTNFVLSRFEDGDDLATAVGRARWRGFCEADPRIDLDGTDAAHKLELVARAAFGEDVALHWMERSGIDHVTPEMARAARAEGDAIRLVASCRRTGDVVGARLAPRRVPAASLLARTRDERNCFVLETEHGEPIVLRGKGAGRWPTTEAVLGDLLELSRIRSRSTQVDALSATEVTT